MNRSQVVFLYISMLLFCAASILLAIEVGKIHERLTAVEQWIIMGGER